MVMAAAASRRSSLHCFGDNEKRWVVFGIALSKVLVPQVRSFVESEIQKEYCNIKSSHGIDTQATPTRLTHWPNVPAKKVFLKYENINGNNTLPKVHGKFNYPAFDCRVTSHIDFAKLYVENFMAKFNAFDEHCDASAVLILLRKVPVFSAASANAASDVQQSRNSWAHCAFNDWDTVKFRKSFDEMKKLVNSLGLPAGDQAKLLADLQDWETNGTRLCMNATVDPALLQLVQDHVNALKSDVEKMNFEMESDRKLVEKALKNFDEHLQELDKRVSRLEQDVRHIIEREQVQKKNWGEMSQQGQSKGNKHGFIHNLSPLKRSRGKGVHWFDFHLQTSPTKVQRVVAFNAPAHQQIQHFQDTKTPVFLKNLIIKQDESDWIFNQQSNVSMAPNSDITFNYKEQLQPMPSTNQLPSVDISVSQLDTMTPNQKVNITGTLSFGKKEPKKVLVKSTQEVSFVKEDCILEDSTGHTSIHIWSPLITQLKNTYSYRLNNLTVKNFQGNTFLSTSPFTTYTQQVNTLSSLKGPAILETPEKQIFVDSFKLVSKLSIFLSCQVCKKRITDVSRTSVKCQNCSTHQKVVDCKREASAKLCVANEDADLWLTIFTDTLKNLLQQVSSVTLQNTTEEVAETLLSASNIFITFDPQTNVVSKMQHALTSDNQSSAKIEATDHNRTTHDNETTFGNAPAYDNETTSENAATHDNETTSGNGATRDNETVSQSGNEVTDDNWLGITNDNQAADENWLDAIDDNTAPDDSWLDAIK